MRKLLSGFSEWFSLSATLSQELKGGFLLLLPSLILLPLGKPWRSQLIKEGWKKNYTSVDVIVLIYLKSFLTARQRAVDWEWVLSDREGTGDPRMISVNPLQFHSVIFVLSVVTDSHTHTHSHTLWDKIPRSAESQDSREPQKRIKYHLYCVLIICPEPCFLFHFLI